MTLTMTDEVDEVAVERVLHGHRARLTASEVNAVLDRLEAIRAAHPGLTKNRRNPWGRANPYWDAVGLAAEGMGISEEQLLREFIRRRSSVNRSKRRRAIKELTREE